MGSRPARRITRRKPTLEIYRAELHVHTVLSPCAEIEMLPPLIVQQAVGLGIRLIAITDHNASANIEAVQKAAHGSELTVLPGMELQTREEVHNLCIFDNLDQVRAFQTWVDARLPNQENRPDFFGDQLVVDENGDFLRREPRLLLTSVNTSIEEACAKVHELDGMFIPAPVNRQAFGLLANLGMVPAELCIEGLEISRHLQPADAVRLFPQVKGYPLIRSGDVHRLEEFLGVNYFTMRAPKVSEMQMAFRSLEKHQLDIYS